jgi:hypothetical protein
MATASITIALDLLDCATVRPARGPGVTKRQKGAGRCGGARQQGVSWGKPAKPFAQVKQRKGA